MKKTINTSSVEYFSSFFGAIFLSFGLGAILSEYFNSYAIMIAAMGLILHAYGMYKIYK